MASFTDDGSDFGIPRLKSAMMSALARYHLATENREQSARRAQDALNEIAPHIADALDGRVLIAYAEAAYLLAESTGAAAVAGEALALLNQRGDESPELQSMKLLLAFKAQPNRNTSEYLPPVTNSDFAADFVPGTEVERWIRRSTQ